ncbi:substrate-binding domain-containing protein [Chloroflexota bacterium]
MKRFFNSLTFKVGAIIILAEIAILAGIGYYYISRFSAEIDRRAITRAELPGSLINSGMMNSLLVADREMMKQLVGGNLEDWLLVSLDGVVAAAFNPDEAGENIQNLARLNPAWFELQITEGLFEKRPDGMIINVTPVRSMFDENSIAYYMYIKMGSEQAEAEEKALVWIFIVGSLVTVILTLTAILLVFNTTVFNRIKGLLGILERVELGDLTARISGPISTDEIGVLQQGVNSMVGQLGGIIGTLEQRVAERSHALELSAEVSRRISTILAQEQLIAEVVEQVRSAFDYYYAQIYLFDEARENLELARGTGEAGRVMLERGHRLPVGRGLVGGAAERNAQVLVPDVYRSIGVEIITQDNVADIYRRETDREFEAQWYAAWIAERFGEINEAKQLARQKPASGQVIQIGYVLHLLTEFTEVMQRGAEVAARDLQVELEMAIPSQAFEHLPLFEAQISKGKDGLVTVPYGEQWPAALQKTIKSGIPVVAANIGSPLTGIMNVLQGNFQSGSMLARELTKFLVAEGKEQGKIILGPGIPDRIQGFMHGMRDTNYSIIQIDESVGLSGATSSVYWQRAIDEHPDLIAAAGLLAFEISTLAELKRASGAEWLVGGYDLETTTIDAIRDGIVQVTIGQHPYLQGYLPVLALVEHLRRGKPLEGWMAEGWLPNPLLSKTRAEMAVPIAIGGEVLGVLDVQHSVASSLTPEDVNLLQSIADQVAIGLQNARLFTEVETALTEIRAAHERYLEQSWKKDRVRSRGEQYHYAQPDAPSLDEAIIVEAKQQALTRDRPTAITIDGSETSEEASWEAPVHSQQSIVAPVTLRDKTIGALHIHPVNDDQQWTEDDLAVVEAVIDQLTQTAESLRLFEDTRERAGREQTIRQITENMRAATSLDELVKIAAEELGQRFLAKYAHVKLGIDT